MAARVGQASPNISATLSQPNPQKMLIEEIRKEAIIVAVAQSNVDTIVSLANRMLIQLDSSEQPVILRALRCSNLFKYNLCYKQSLLREQLEKNGLKWMSEELAIKKGVADLQKSTPEMFLDRRKPLSFEQLEALSSEMILSIRESFKT
jgi:activator of 2-hydroxyglutaryl-CoA dehydratase